VITDRQLEVLLLLAQGLTNHQIALRLGIQVQSVRNICSGLYKRMGVVNSHGAVVRGLIEGIITMEDLR
jgi:DNA-binding NarL/FixJ family response regulator